MMHMALFLLVSVIWAYACCSTVENSEFARLVLLDLVLLIVDCCCCTIV